ncbi:hypothetical protein FOZ60_011701, partial [Perkinsus olseni]
TFNGSPAVIVDDGYRDHSGINTVDPHGETDTDIEDVDGSPTVAFNDGHMGPFGFQQGGSDLMSPLRAMHHQGGRHVTSSLLPAASSVAKLGYSLPLQAPTVWRYVIQLIFDANVSYDPGYSISTATRRVTLYLMVSLMTKTLYGGIVSSQLRLFDDLFTLYIDV